MVCKLKPKSKRGPLLMKNYRAKRKKKTSSNIFSRDGKILKDELEIVNAFNNYFTSIGPSLANKFDQNNNYLKYLDDAPNCRLYFKPVEEHYIIKITDKLKNKKRSSSDGMSNSLIKLVKCPCETSCYND